MTDMALPGFVETPHQMKNEMKVAGCWVDMMMCISRYGMVSTIILSLDTLLIETVPSKNLTTQDPTVPIPTQNWKLVGESFEIFECRPPNQRFQKAPNPKHNHDGELNRPLIEDDDDDDDGNGILRKQLPRDLLDNICIQPTPLPLTQ